MRMMKRTTIKDVAALAGVSCATVSRAMDDRPEISAETKARVRAACVRLGYVPNAAARGLAGQSTHTIGLIVPDISNPYFAGMTTAIEQAAARNGYRVLLSNSLRDRKRELEAVDAFLSRQIDGIIISALSPQGQAAHREMLGTLPHLYLGVNHDTDCSYVMPDNAAGAYEAVRYLLCLGHRNIVFLGGRNNSRTREQRILGFHRALEEAGLPGRVLPGPEAPETQRQWDYERALELFHSRPLPDAIFAFSDMAALKVLEAAEACGVRIPEDLSLVGFDNIFFSGLPRIHLTTVSQKKHRQGRLAVERLLEQIHGRAASTADLIQPELLIRSTCRKRP